MGRGLLEMVKLSAAVPRGEEGYWSIIRELDAQGPWTIRQVADRTNVSLIQVTSYVRKLRFGGFAEPIGQAANRPHGPRIKSAIVYRLAKMPFDAPRLRADGSPLPEPAYEQLWRAMKMAKTFGSADLTEACPGIRISTARSYCGCLVAAGILSRKGHVYRLVKNLGPRAPRVLQTKIVFDPNSRDVVGSPVAREVTP